jgi:Na+/H+-dicarboxylate symporter
LFRLSAHFFPGFGKSLKPLGDGFIKLVKMMIAPIIFCTVVHGVASVRDLARLGRVGIKTLFYFEIVSTLALIIGLIVVNVFKPGAGFNIDPATLDPNIAAAYAPGHWGLGHGSGAHAPDEYYVIESGNSNIEGIDGATMSFVEYFYELAK